MAPPKSVEQYQGVSSLSDEAEEAKSLEGFKRKKRKKYAGFLPPYFPQVMAVVTGKCFATANEKKVKKRH